MAARVWLRLATTRVISSELPSTLRPGKTIFFVSNHQSPLDVAISIDLMSRASRLWYQIAEDALVQKYGSIYGDSYISIGSDSLTHAAQIRAIRELIRSTTAPTALWMYPEGGYRHTKRGLGEVAGGTQRILRNLDIDIVCVGIRYRMYRTSRPIAVLSHVHLMAESPSSEDLTEGILDALDLADRKFDAEASSISGTFRRAVP